MKNGLVVQEFDLKRNGSTVCLDTLIAVQPEKDSWYVLIAHGDQAMFPMVGKLERPVKPLGFTNAVWIDADGNDKILSILDYAKKVVDENNNNINGKKYNLWFSRYTLLDYLVLFSSAYWHN